MKILIDCPTCKGCGKVDAKEGKAWVDVTTPKPNPEVRAGRLTAKDCPQCAGSGKIESEQEATLPEIPGNPAPVAPVAATPPATVKPVKSGKAS